LYICGKEANFLIFVGNVMKSGQMKYTGRAAHRYCHVMRLKIDSKNISGFLTVKLESYFLAFI